MSNCNNINSREAYQMRIPCLTASRICDSLSPLEPCHLIILQSGRACIGFRRVHSHDAVTSFLEDRNLDGELPSDSRGDLGGGFRSATETGMATSRTRELVSMADAETWH